MDTMLRQMFANTFDRDGVLGQARQVGAVIRVMIPQVLPANSTRHHRGPSAVVARHERV